MKHLKNKIGFTLMETLVVIGVIAVLCAISIPGIFSAKKSLDIVEANATAKELFIAAQNRLTAMKENGQLKDVLDEMGDDYAVTTISNTYFQGNGDDALKGYLLSDNIFSNINGSYVVELNPSTGDIKSVFFWTKDDDLKDIYLHGKAAGENGEAAIKALIEMSEDERKALTENTLIGYYSANDTSSAPSGIQSFEPIIKVYNGNDLYLSVIQENLSSISGFDISKLYVYLEFEDEHGNTNEIEISPDNIDDYTKSSGNSLELYFLLDSYDYNSCPKGKLNYLYNTTSGGSSVKVLTEGDDIKVTVSLKCESDNMLITSNPAKGTAQFNSLFGAKTNTNSSCSITIWNFRHLKNIAKINNTDNSPYVGNPLSIVQTIDIDCNQTTWCNDGSDELSAIIPLRSVPTQTYSALTSINLDYTIKEISATAGKGVHTIKNIQLCKNGLFKTINDCSVSGITIVNPSFSSSGESDNVGVLAGSIIDSRINKCGVYYEGTTVKTLEGNNNVGGLSGSVTGSSTITSCYANINLKGTKKVGGLFGYTDVEVSISNCYSSGKTEGTEKVGGFIGYANSSNIQNCFTTCDVNGTNQTGGFVGQIDLDPDLIEDSSDSMIQEKDLVFPGAYRIRSLKTYSVDTNKGLGEKNIQQKYLYFQYDLHVIEFNVGISMWDPFALTDDHKKTYTNFYFDIETLKNSLGTRSATGFVAHPFATEQNNNGVTVYEYDMGHYIASRYGLTTSEALIDRWTFFIMPIKYGNAYYFFSFDSYLTSGGFNDAQAYYSRKDAIDIELDKEYAKGTDPITAIQNVIKNTGKLSCKVRFLYVKTRSTATQAVVTLWNTVKNIGADGKPSSLYVIEYDLGWDTNPSAESAAFAIVKPTYESDSSYTGSALIKNCYAYGKVNAAKAVNNTVAGFTATDYDEAFYNCYYLRDGSYNAKFQEITSGGIQSQTKSQWQTNALKPMVKNGDGSTYIYFQGLEYAVTEDGAINYSSDINFYWGNEPMSTAS